ncbi:MAG: hypothetical protein FWC68_00680 [Oscillospiraceae bacterium]|nr:hypothetical protein [Oscillospiraceae bacterium]
MKEEYKIAGIEKIIEKVGKKDLARFYGTDENADFVQIITQSLRERGVPNGLAVAEYHVAKQEERFSKEKTNEMVRYSEESGKALIEVSMSFGAEGIEKLYLEIDEPIRSEDVQSIQFIKMYIGGVQTLDHIMRKRLLSKKYRRYKGASTTI